MRRLDSIFGRLLKRPKAALTIVTALDRARIDH
jgi:hypothetical protein